MKSLRLIFKSLALSLLLVGSVLTATAVAGEKVDINTADAATLEQLVNVGPAKAAAIVEYREANGPFRSAEELALVAGIGLKTVEKNLDLIEVGNTASRQPAARSGSSSAGSAAGR
ncbi:ComEA family DNA-binding protein [Marilutibacter alkalisoli]|uniref:Helix-hairpin-helix domain-containing protein n=1 Tax=Marilutibacter alkalisoli TaxID=2591633 RepID=A0A514BPQ7_9GAMM|nr:ComEA family DNA-binding protein [Lysobacter alkalisoli]QDH69364.1 helix-hairpin-helix domain-containing protein [Lysobacter alkalisoli]